MFRLLRERLELRLIVLSGGGLLAAYVLFGLLSAWAVAQGMREGEAARRVLVDVIADRVASIVRNQVDLLQEAALAVRFHGSATMVDEAALHRASLHTIFSSLRVADRQGRVLAAIPASATPVPVALRDERPFLTDVRDGAVSAVMPIRNPLGSIEAVLIADIPVDHERLAHAVGLGDFELVDGAGTRIAGRPAAIPVTHQAPVEGTGWRVRLRLDPAKSVVPMRVLMRGFLLAGLPLLVLSVLVAWGTARSVLRPIQAVGHAAERITAGNLATPVPAAGLDEVGRLSRTLDQMRVSLLESLQRMQGWNAELERRVEERTRALAAQEQARHALLRKVISAQEEERRRIARELHDETSQSLAALILSIDRALQGDASSRLEDVKALAVRTLDEVHALIFDLRPSLLDDLGLVAALRWYAESRLEPLGVRVSVVVTGDERRLEPEVETALFRALQEAISNVARHAEADHAWVRMRLGPQMVEAEVEDDGRGFDVAGAGRHAGSMRGLGLLGMEERVSLLGGTMMLESRPGRGTRVRFALEVGSRDPCAAGR